MFEHSPFLLLTELNETTMPALQEQMASVDAIDATPRAIPAIRAGRSIPRRGAGPNRSMPRCSIGNVCDPWAMKLLRENRSVGCCIIRMASFAIRSVGRRRDRRWITGVGIVFRALE